jgi:hypothetical protein
MIHHIVMIKLKPFSGKEEKLEKANEIKERLEALPSIINEIKFYEVGLNVIESERASDVVLISKFDTLDTLDVYRVHPEHQKVVALIGEYAEKVTAVDYEK